MSMETVKSKLDSLAGSKNDLHARGENHLIPMRVSGPRATSVPAENSAFLRICRGVSGRPPRWRRRIKPTDPRGDLSRTTSIVMETMVAQIQVKAFTVGDLRISGESSGCQRGGCTIGMTSAHAERRLSTGPRFCATKNNLHVRGDDRTLFHRPVVSEADLHARGENAHLIGTKAQIHGRPPRPWRRSSTMHRRVIGEADLRLYGEI